MFGGMLEMMRLSVDSPPEIGPRRWFPVPVFVTGALILCGVDAHADAPPRGATSGGSRPAVAGVLGTQPLPPPPMEEFRAKWWTNITSHLRPCDDLARRKHVFGDVTLTFSPAPRRPVAGLGSRQLGASVQRCVNGALDRFARDLVADGPPGRGPSVVLPLGEPRPLLPENPEFLSTWFETASKGSSPQSHDHAKLAAALPPDVTADADGCLLVAPTPLLGVGVDLWLKDHSQRVDPTWLTSRRLASFGQDATSAYLVDHRIILRTFFKHNEDGNVEVPPGVPDRRRRLATLLPLHRLCVQPLDAKLLDAFAGDLSKVGACWRPPQQTLIAPGFEFPRDRRFRTVRSNDDGSACALDEAGGVTCCGNRRITQPSVSAVAIDTRPGVLCLVDKSRALRCVSLDDGHEVARLPGQFESVSASDRGAHLCGVRSDGAAICAATDARVPPEGRFRSVDASGPCGIAEEGSVYCWSRGPLERVGDGRYQALAAEPSGITTICALDLAGVASCWEPREVAQHPRRASDLRFQQIDVDRSGQCGTPKDGCGIRCWNEVLTRNAPAVCFRDISLGAPACGVTAEGHVLCWGDPLWDEHAEGARKLTP